MFVSLKDGPIQVSYDDVGIRKSSYKRNDRMRSIQQLNVDSLMKA